MAKPFDDADYTEDNVIIELTLIEKHGIDGSVLDAGCHCVEGKHLYLLEGYSNEGVSIMSETKKKEFLASLAAFARSTRRNMEADDWDMRKVLHEAGLNPGVHRAFLPHGLTSEEAGSRELRHALSSCIKDAELHCCGGHTTHYEECSCNPVAVCRAAIEH